MTEIEEDEQEWEFKIKVNKAKIKRKESTLSMGLQSNGVNLGSSQPILQKNRSSFK